MRPTNSTTTEEVSYYKSAKIRNPTDQKHTVRAVYETSAPVEQQRIIEERVLEPTSHVHFPERSYVLKEDPQSKKTYEFSRLELMNAHSNVQPTAEELRPVIFESKHHRKNNKHHDKSEIEVEIVQDNGT
eukprot:CAMPEP_0117451550 /NCGR_PEP_ID=MMETSP0759-20121206/9071_1 /TAXON_ID=63605 /ORGANISM="Percolomonas cosmopolitus, Strain WS" /LENGTH=129 /DNA_ID=CAMNT_0005244165 /DNA_START=31 /DNA_END=417 /DNA_ORIENTATION=+